MMNSTDETLLGRIRALNLSGMLSHYLTPISIGVLVVGVAMVVLGPVRTMAASRSASPSAGAGSGQTSAATGIGADNTTLDQLSRSLVPFTIIPDRPRNTVSSYTIKGGDTLFGIAGEFGLKPQTIFWSNKGKLNDNIHMILPGITLSILPIDGVYIISDGKKTFAQIAKDYEVEPSAIIDSQYNNFAGKLPEDTPSWGTPVVIPGGTSTFSVPPVITAVSTGTSGSSGSSGQVVYGFMQGMSGSCAAGLAGSGGTGAWISPLSSYSVTQAYAPWHAGIDLGAVLGTPVYAADTGVVIFAGWVPQSWGYGQLVVLDHGNGWTTYYAHLNSISVRCGQTVSRGGGIGGVGTTGNSNGAHLHFEMRWSHTPDNPASYIGF